jgi:hypothetical protein
MVLKHTTHEFFKKNSPQPPKRGFMGKTSLYNQLIINNNGVKPKLIITELVSALTLGQTLREWNNKRLDAIQRKSFGRILTSFGWVGTAGAAADGALEIFEDLNSIMKLYNYAADSIITRDRIIGLEGYIPSKHNLDIECIDAMSNTAYIHMSFLEQRPGESLVGKIQGSETTLFESIGQPSLGDGSLMEATKELGYHKVDENNDRFVSFVTLVDSSAVGDTGIEFTVDGDFRGSLYNNPAATKVIGHNSWLPANIYIPKGSTFDVACIDAAAADVSLGLKILKLTDSPMAAQIESAKPDEV